MILPINSQIDKATSEQSTLNYDDLKHRLHGMKSQHFELLSLHILLQASNEIAMASPGQFANFCQVAFPMIISELVASFSNSVEFVKKGVKFKLIENEPVGFLAASAEKLNLDLSLLMIPKCYSIILKLLIDETKASTDLIFDLVHIIQKKEVSHIELKLSDLNPRILKICNLFSKPSSEN